MKIESKYETLIIDARDENVKWSDLFEKTNDYLDTTTYHSKIQIGKNGKCKKFTIAIPTFKRTESLKEAIRSAVFQNVSEDNFDVIVVDNNPNQSIEFIDSIKKEFESFENFRYYVNEINVGMFANMNKCFELSNSDWVIILHDDDLISSNYIETFQNFDLEEYSVIFNQHLIVYDKNDNQKTFLSTINSLVRYISAIGNTRYMLWNFLKEPSACCVMYHRAKAIECGGYSSVFGDIGFWVKSNYYYKVIKVNKQLSSYRISINESKNINFQISSFYFQNNLLNEYFKRRTFSPFFSEMSRQILLIYFYQLFKLMYSENTAIFTEIIKKLRINRILFVLPVRILIFYLVTIYKTIFGNFYLKALKETT